jgi:hypothetical protein
VAYEQSVIPKLKTIADDTDDSRLSEAAKHAKEALVHMDIMLEELRTSIDFIQPPPLPNSPSPAGETA